MSDDQTKPGLEEKYGSAVTATDLRMVHDRTGSADLLATVGISAGLGALLLRLRTEFDSVKGEHGLAEAEFFRMRGLVDAKLKESQREVMQMDKGPTRAALYAKEATWLRAEADGAAATATALVMMHLKTLRETKEALGRYAVLMATKRRHMLTDKQVYALTGKTLAAWLDHKCHACGGVGRVGGYNGRRPKQCSVCEGTGNRKIELGQNDAQRRFCADLMHAMNQKSGSGVARDVRVNRKAIRQGKEKIQEGIASAT